MILLIGSTGYIGTEFVRCLQDEGMDFRTAGYLDVMDDEFEKKKFLSGIDCVINASGYTGKPNVDKAEEEKDKWIHVDDHCSALMDILDTWIPGEQYLIGTGEENSNLELVEAICDYFDQLTDSRNSRNLISFVSDRPGHDFRYSVDSSKLRKRFHWNHEWDMEGGMLNTIEWYLNND